MSQGKMATWCPQKQARNQCLPVLFKGLLKAVIKMTESPWSDQLSLNTPQSIFFF